MKSIVIAVKLTEYNQGPLFAKKKTMLLSRTARRIENSIAVQ